MRGPNKLLRAMMVATAAGGLLFVLGRIEIPGGSQWAFWWNNIPQSTRDFGAVVTTIAVALLQLLVSVLHLRRGATTQSVGSSFPFECFSTNDIDALRTHRKLYDLPYQARFFPSRQRSFEQAIDTQFLLLTGRRGLGKTRECIELFTRLARKKGEEVMIIYPKSDDFDRPRDADIPAEFSPRTLILFIDEIEGRIASDTSNLSQTGPPARSFFDRLSATMEWMKGRHGAKDWRVVLTAVDEPDNLKNLQLGSGRWSQFKLFQLPGIHRNARAPFAQGVARHYGMRLDNSALAYIVSASDGTPAGMIIPLMKEFSSSGEKSLPLTLIRRDVNNYRFSYPYDWESEVYDKQIAPYPVRCAVFEALATLRQLRIPSYVSLVTDLAASLWPGRGVLWMRKRAIARAVSQDLRAWMFVHDDQIICPTAYLHYGLDVSATFPNVLRSIRKVIGQAPLFEKMIPQIASLYHVSYRLGFKEECLALLLVAAKHGPQFVPLSIAIAVLLGQMGRRAESLRVAEEVVKAHPGNSAALMCLAIARSRAALYDQAVVAARQAATLAPLNDFAWLNLGVALGKRGSHDEAVDALRRACALNPHSTRAWYSLGVAYDRINQHQMAVEACANATKLDPANAEAWHTLGIAYHRANELEKALRALETSRLLDDRNGAILVSLSRLYSVLGKKDRALAMLRSAETRAAGNPDLLCDISVALGVSGLHKEAMVLAQKALILRPNSPDAIQSFYLNWEYMFDYGERSDEFLKEGFIVAKDQYWNWPFSFILVKILTATNKYDWFRDDLVVWLRTNEFRAEHWAAKLEIVLKVYRSAKEIIDESLFMRACDGLAKLDRGDPLWGAIWVSLFELRPADHTLVTLGSEWQKANLSAPTWPSVWLRLSALPGLTEDIAQWGLFWLETSRGSHNKWPDVWKRMWSEADDSTQLVRLAVGWLESAEPSPRQREARLEIHRMLTEAGHLPAMI